LLDESLKVVAGILLLSAVFLLRLAFLDCFVAADSESDLPVFVFLGAHFAKDDLGEDRLFDGEEVLWVFAPAGVVLDVSLLLPISVFFYLDFARAACRSFSPGSFHCELDGFRQF
jgi:hypothetical protein